MNSVRLPRYLGAMRKSIGSKLFFLDKVPVDDLAVVVDFGCADGSLLKALDAVLPEGCTKIGVDKNPAMLRAAKYSFVGGDLWTDDIGDCAHYLGDMPEGGKSLLILSSVMHEVDDPVALWDELSMYPFDYVVFRDMAPTERMFRTSIPSRWLAMFPSLPADERSVIQDTAEHHHRSELVIAPSVASFVHGLLKLVHKEDYADEREENFFRMSANEIAGLLTERGYSVEHSALTATPFFRRFCRERGFNLDDCSTTVTTHVELVLRRIARRY